jgi:oligo-1,6-glucosidase
MQFIFDLVDMECISGEARMTLNPWDVRKMKSIVTKYQRAMIERDGWNSGLHRESRQPSERFQVHR